MAVAKNNLYIYKSFVHSNNISFVQINLAKETSYAGLTRPMITNLMVNYT